MELWPFSQRKPIFQGSHLFEKIRLENVIRDRKRSLIRKEVEAPSGLGRQLLSLSKHVRTKMVTRSKLNGNKIRFQESWRTLLMKSTVSRDSLDSKAFSARKRYNSTTLWYDRRGKQLRHSSNVENRHFTRKISDFLCLRGTPSFPRLFLSQSAEWGAFQSSFYESHHHRWISYNNTAIVMISPTSGHLASPQVMSQPDPPRGAFLAQIFWCDGCIEP